MHSADTKIGCFITERCCFAPNCLTFPLRALNVNTSKFEGKGIKSVESRVTNISEHLQSPLTLAEFKQLITVQIQSFHQEFELYSLTKQDIHAVQTLAKNKYMAWE